MSGTAMQPRTTPVTAQSLVAIEAFCSESLDVRQALSGLFRGRRYTKGAPLITQKDPDRGKLAKRYGSPGEPPRSQLNPSFHRAPSSAVLSSAATNDV